MGKKVVLDTNVFVSALGWKGASREIFKDCIEGSLELFISTEIFDEIKRVLNYPKFRFSQDEINEFLDQILEVGNLVETKVKIEKIKDDPSDNKFLECAVTVDADSLLSKIN
jgi:putative PIN family toxin of toxin-antitoxin system